MARKKWLQKAHLPEPVKRFKISSPKVYNL